MSFMRSFVLGAVVCCAVVFALGSFIEPVSGDLTRLGAVAGPWSALSGLAVSGYEIHPGRTVQHPAMAAAGNGAPFSGPLVAGAAVAPRTRAT